METCSVWMVFVHSHLLFSALNLGPVQIGLAWVLTTFGVSQLEVDSSCAPDPPKARADSYQFLAGLIIWYEYVRDIIVYCFLLFPIPFICTV